MGGRATGAGSHAAATRRLRAGEPWHASRRQQRTRSPPVPCNQLPHQAIMDLLDLRLWVFWGGASSECCTRENYNDNYKKNYSLRSGTVGLGPCARRTFSNARGAAAAMAVEACGPRDGGEDPCGAGSAARCCARSGAWSNGAAHPSPPPPHIPPPADSSSVPASPPPEPTHPDTIHTSRSVMTKASSRKPRSSSKRACSVAPTWGGGEGRGSDGPGPRGPGQRRHGIVAGRTRWPAPSLHLLQLAVVLSKLVCHSCQFCDSCKQQPDDHKCAYDNLGQRTYDHWAAAGSCPKTDNHGEQAC